MIFVQHPTSGFPAVDDGSGHLRVLGCLPDPRKRSYLPQFSAAYPVIPRSQWVEFELPDDDLPVLDQDGHGSCVGYGSCLAGDATRAEA